MKHLIKNIIATVTLFASLSVPVDAQVLPPVQRSKTLEIKEQSVEIVKTKAANSQPCLIRNIGIIGIEILIFTFLLGAIIIFFNASLFILN
jgi:hypothetical protein